MKTSCIFILTLLLVSCSSRRQSALLTAGQAKSVAMQLANDQAFALYHCQPFRDGQPARLVAGRWIWAEQQGIGHFDIQATVELGVDGCTNKVEVQLLDSQAVLF